MDTKHWSVDGVSATPMFFSFLIRNTELSLDNPHGAYVLNIEIDVSEQFQKSVCFR